MGRHNMPVLGKRKMMSKNGYNIPAKQKGCKTMTMTMRNLAVCCCMAAVTACSNLEYHPYSARYYGSEGIQAEAIRRIEEMCAGKDTICFAFITDTQAAYDEMRDAMRFLDSRQDVMFIVHGGDQSDFGLTKEFLWARDILETQTRPFVCLIGNHDCLGTGEHTFERMYGKPNFSLNAGFLHLVGLNTVALEYDYSNPVPDFTYIEDDYSKTSALGDSITNTIVMMHAPPHDEQFNDNVARLFQYCVRQYPGLRTGDIAYPDEYEDVVKAGTRMRGFCLNGHTHRTDIKHIFGDGVLYYGLTNAADREIRIFTITKNGYECETIDF